MWNVDLFTQTILRKYHAQSHIVTTRRHRDLQNDHEEMQSDYNETQNEKDKQNNHSEIHKETQIECKTTTKKLDYCHCKPYSSRDQ